MQENEIWKVIEQYGWEPTLIQHAGGVWRIRSGDKTFALKRSKASREKLLLLHQMLEKVRSQGYNHLLPWVATTNGEWVATESNSHWYATTWKDAYGIAESERKPSAVELMRALARFHCLAEATVEPYPELKQQVGEREITQWKRKQEQLKEEKVKRQFQSPFDKVLEANQENLDKSLLFAIRGMERFIEAEQGKAPRYTLCHCRVHPSNTVQETDQFYFIDFDHAQVNSPVRDIATVLRRYTAERGYPEKPFELLEAYEAEWKLQPKEKKLLALYLAYPERIVKIVDQYYNGSNISQTESLAVRKLEAELKQLDALQDLVKSLWPNRKAREEKSSTVVAISEKTGKKKSDHKQRKR